MTLEELFVKQYKELEKENKTLKAKLEIKQKEIEEKLMQIDELKKCFSLVKSQTFGEYYISCDNVWEKYDKEKFDSLMKLCGFEKEGVNNDK